MKVFSLSLLVAPALSQSLYHFNQAGEVYKSDQKVPSVTSWTNILTYHHKYISWDPWIDISCNNKNQCWGISKYVKQTTGSVFTYLWYIDATAPTVVTQFSQRWESFLWKGKACQYQGSHWNPKSVHPAHKDGSVFVIDSKNDIYKLEGPEATEWEKTGVQGIDVAPLEYGRAYIVRPSGELFQYVKNHWPDETYYEDITGLPHGATKIAYCPPYELKGVFQKHQKPKTLYALDKNGRMWTHGKGFDRRMPESWSWQMLSGFAVDIVCKGDEEVFHLGDDGNIYSLYNHKYKLLKNRGLDERPNHGSWWKIPGKGVGLG